MADNYDMNELLDDPQVVAIITIAETVEIWDGAYNWETTQNYVLQGYTAQAVRPAGYGFETVDKFQTAINEWREQYKDCWGV